MGAGVAVVLLFVLTALPASIGQAKSKLDSPKMRTRE
jgi:hypothetical protein